MGESEKEIAFLRGLTVEPDWTQRFTDFLDEKIEIGEPQTLTYLNAGAGNHAIALFEKLGVKTDLFPVCESRELQETAQLKANTEKIGIDFSTKLPMGKSELAITDASLDDPEQSFETAKAAIEASKDRVVFFMPTSGSFGEIFSYLWEVLFDLEIRGKNAELEHLINSIPTVSGIKDQLRSLDLREISSHVKNEVFEYENGKEFTESLLIRHFFFPRWLAFLDEKDKERVIEKLAQKIDDESEGLTFRFSVKATVFEARH